MAGREEGVELVAGGCERERMCTLFCGNASELLHRLRGEDIDDAWITDGHEEAVVHAIEERDIWGATQGILAQHFSRTRIEPTERIRRKPSH